MPAIKTLGEEQLFTEKQLKKIAKTKETRKYAIPLEIDIYGDILVHHFWPMDMIATINARWLQEEFDLHDLKFRDDTINIECGNCLQNAALIFELSMTDDSAKLFNEILGNIARFTKTSHYPAIGIVEVPVGTKVVPIKDVFGCEMVVDSDIKLTNIICGFSNDEKFFKNFEFTGYDQENVEKLPQVVKLSLNHNMY